MKPINTLVAILFISLLSSPSWSATLGDLVERNGLYYEQFTDVPYTGEVTGDTQGSFKSGKKDGAWISYWDNGQLSYEGNYKNDKREGVWVSYFDDGTLNRKGSFTNGINEGTWAYYHRNGQLSYKGNWKNGKQDRAWASYNEDGTVDKASTGTFKDGVKISD
jgi:hypothetical protein